MGSFVHGSGRSTVADAIYSEIKRLPAVRLSTGDFFRKIVRKWGYTDVNRFVEEVMRDPKKAVAIDTEIDRRFYHEIRRLVGSGRIVIIDSNLHVHPHALRGVPSVHLYVYAYPWQVGERVYRASRSSERPYRSPEEAFEKQVTRTLTDANRYAVLSDLVGDPILKDLYREGGKFIRRLLREYIVWTSNKKVLVRRLGVMTRGKGIFVDNTGSKEETWEKVLQAFSRLTGTSVSC